MNMSHGETVIQKPINEYSIYRPCWRGWRKAQSFMKKGKPVSGKSTMRMKSDRGSSMETEGVGSRNHMIRKPSSSWTDTTSARRY